MRRGFGLLGHLVVLKGKARSLGAGLSDLRISAAASVRALRAATDEIENCTSSGLRDDERMRLYVVFLLLAMVASAKDLPALKTVASVDLDRYMGRWYEVARLPNRFQTDCAAEVTATYAKQPHGRLSVGNACRKADGSFMSATGAARKVGAAKLKVRFAPPWLTWLPMVWGDYWVIDLAEDYSWAVVGEPGREYFWILSRAPEIGEGVFQGIVERAEKQGYDLTAMTRTKQVGAAN